MAAVIGVQFPDGMKVDVEGDPNKAVMVNNIINNGGDAVFCSDLFVIMDFTFFD